MSVKECDVALAKRHEEKSAWVLESCLRGKNRPRVSSGQRVRIKECDKDSRIKPVPSIVGNKALPLKNKVAEACAKLLNKVISKDRAFEDKSRSANISRRGDDPKWALKINMGGSTIKTNGEGCILAQVPSPRGKA